MSKTITVDHGILLQIYNDHFRTPAPEEYSYVDIAYLENEIEPSLIFRFNDCLYRSKILIDVDVSDAPILETVCQEIKESRRQICMWETFYNEIP